MTSPKEVAFAIGMQSIQPAHDQQPRLNFDVLRMVCNCLTDVSDVLSFGTTCTALRKGALQRRLRMSPFILSSSMSVDRLHSLLFADEAARAPFLYGVACPVFHFYSQDVLIRFAAILKAATNLKSLYVPARTGNPIITAICDLTTLRELHVLASVGDDSLRTILKNLRSPLRYLHVEGYELGTFSAKFLHNELSHLGQTLEALKLDDFPLDIPASSVKTRFTSVRSLEADEIDISSDLGQLDVLLELFPNLDTTFALGPPGPTIPVPEVERRRQRNMETQKTRTWPRLDRLVCDARMAYILALRCPIRLMTIDTTNVFDGRRYLAESLRYNAPQQLHFSLELNDGLALLDWLFPPEAAVKLTRLVMFFNHQISRRPQTLHRASFQWQELLGRLIVSIKHLRLTHLRLVVCYHVFQSMSKRTQPNMGVDEDFVNTARESDLLPAATAFLEAMPSLEYIFLTTCGRTYVPVGRRWEERHKWLSSKAWRVAGRHEGPDVPSAATGMLVELSSEAAEVIIDREEFQLSLREEVQVKACISPIH
ncbi:hypothetical protein BD309DRAFT_950064 [Dichomitus squalens]|nr:hypothetical protein BD309DRAFT_950064 [Dichomitus squalens]